MENNLFTSSFFGNHLHIWICYYIYVWSFLRQAKQSGFLQALLLDYAFQTLILLISLLNSFQLVCMSLEAWCLKLDTDPYSGSLIAPMKEDYSPVYIQGSASQYDPTYSFCPRMTLIRAQFMNCNSPQDPFSQNLCMRNRRMLPQKFRLTLVEALSIARWQWA